MHGLRLPRIAAERRVHRLYVFCPASLTLTTCSRLDEVDVTLDLPCPDCGQQMYPEQAHNRCPTWRPAAIGASFPADRRGQQLNAGVIDLVDKDGVPVDGYDDGADGCGRLGG